MIEKVKNQITRIGQKYGLGFVALICMMCFLAMVLPTSALSESGKPVWIPEGTLPEGFDWIQLTNGEWFKGDLKVLYDDSLEFDSDEMGLYSFDWEDVHQVICHQSQSVRIEDHESRSRNVLDIYGDAETVVGKLRIKGAKFLLTPVRKLGSSTAAA